MNSYEQPEEAQTRNSHGTLHLIVVQWLELNPHDSPMATRRKAILVDSIRQDPGKIIPLFPTDSHADQDIILKSDAINMITPSGLSFG